MAKEIFKLRKEHVNTNKLLDILDAQLDLLHKGEDPDYRLMTDILYYMTQYSDLIHHPREEAIFSLLLERDSNAEQDVAEITRQHHTLGDSGAHFYEKLENIINGESEIMQLQEIEVPGRLYVTALRAHMDQEEQSLFVMAEQLLNDDDWRKVKTETLSKPDPIFGEAIEDRFHSVCDQLVRSSSNT
ncbi:MAG: hypothetical protein E2O88_11770 [Bacteroidetes bacterium]|nr:MAG: hypothetical protein E2O88_11770 [Bacteroidota bacterium]